uniref:Multifunctional fusion protein n=1 Tax=Ochotona princeps TaxID=9978 RepID=A0A0N9HNN1_OCHPR|nr:interleukin 1 beta [Ochotona princeps]
MAIVPELASEMTAYHSGSENDLFFEENDPKSMKSYLLDPDEGIQLHISPGHHNKSFQQVLSIIVSLEKLKKKAVPCPLAFQDGGLRTFFSLIFEEELLYDTEDDSFECDAIQSLHCKLRDAHQKCLTLSESYELRALHLSAQNLNQQVVFSMNFVQGEESIDKIPVALGLRGKNLYLSCVMKDEKPTLQLESVDPNHYPRKKMEKRFVFNKIEIKDKVEFESAQFPNWYISTSQAQNMPVFLGKNIGGRDITDFSMEFVSS